MILANILSSAALAISFWEKYKEAAKTKLYMTAGVTFFSFMLILSAIVLLRAVLKIRTFLKER